MIVEVKGSEWKPTQTMKQVKESQTSIFYLIILTTVAVYSLCFAYKHFLSEEGKGICGSDDIPPFEITIIDIFKGAKNSSKSARSLDSSAAHDKATLLELYELETGVFSLSIYLDVPWIQDYASKESKAYETLAMIVAGGIEDLYDKEFFAMEKSIDINVDSIEEFDEIFGVLIRMKVFRLSGKILYSELKDVIQNGAAKFFNKILKHPQRVEEIDEATGDYDNYHDETSTDNGTDQEADFSGQHF